LGGRDLMMFADQVVNKERFAQFSNKGMPRRVEEAWRYTRAEWLSNIPWVLPQASHRSAQIAGDEGTIQFVDGCCQYTQLPEGVSLSIVDKMDWEASDIEDSLVDLVQAITPCVYVLKVKGGVKVKKPIGIKVTNTNSKVLLPIMMHIVCDEAASMRVNEHLCLQEGAAMMMIKVSLAKDSCLRLARLDDAESSSYILRYLHAEVFAGAIFEQGHLGRKAGHIKSLSQIDLKGKAAHAECSSVALSREREKLDHQTIVRHSSSRTTSTQYCRSLLDDSSLQVFNSKVKVDAGAQKVDSMQQHKSILLNKRARVYTKPELEIYADDVRCNHGAAVGQFDKSALFYLRSRGLDDVSAKSLMVKAFVQEMADRWSEGVQQMLCPCLEACLAKWVK
jgi:Fe-S cluster assembly protein SufD